MSEITSKTFTPTEIRAIIGREVAIPVTIASGKTLAKGTVLGRVTSSGLYDAYDNTANTGLEVASGVLAQEVDTSATGCNTAMEAAMYIHGDLKKDALTGWDSSAASDLKAVDVPGRNIITF